MNAYPHKKPAVYKRWVAASFLLLCLVLGAMLFVFGKIGQKPADRERRLVSSPSTSAESRTMIRDLHRSYVRRGGSWRQ